MRKFSLLPILAGLLLNACGKKKDAAQRLDAFPVKTVAAQKRNLEETIILVSNIKAKDEATLFSRVPGKLKENLVKEGQSVRKGQAVALVERDEVGVRFEPAPVPSTLDGLVARTYLDRGENVTLQSAVALVVDQSQVSARSEVPERYAGRARVGQSVRMRVEAYPDRAFHGRVSKVSPVVDPATRTTWIEAALENPSGLLRSGMFGELTLITGSRSGVLSVPKDALTEGSGPAVFVAASAKAQKREVELGLQSDGFVEILKGLRPGEPVVVFGLYGLKDGSPIEVLTDQP